MERLYKGAELSFQGLCRDDLWSSPRAADRKQVERKRRGYSQARRRKKGGLMGSKWPRWKPQRSLGETGEAVGKKQEGEKSENNEVRGEKAEKGKWTERGGVAKEE